MDHLDIINAETDRFLKAIRQTPPDAPVPSCPDWTADDLLWHLTEVHAFWAGILRTGALTDEDSEAVEETKPQRPEDREAVIALLVDETAALVAELAARDDGDPAWSWFPPDQTVGFTRRMQVHEATMHRVDAELAAGLTPAPIAHDVAADGIAHGIQVMWGWWGTNPGFEFHPTAGTVELHASDGGTWRVAGGRWRGVGRESGKQYDEPGAVLLDAAASLSDASLSDASLPDADAALLDDHASQPSGSEPAASVTGTAEELYRWLWGRGSEPATTGDEASLDALREARAQGMQ